MPAGHVAAAAHYTAAAAVVTIPVSCHTCRTRRTPCGGSCCAAPTPSSACRHRLSSRMPTWQQPAASSRQAPQQQTLRARIRSRQQWGWQRVRVLQAAAATKTACREQQQQQQGCMVRPYSSVSQLMPGTGATNVIHPAMPTPPRVASNTQTVTQQRIPVMWSCSWTSPAAAAADPAAPPSSSSSKGAGHGLCPHPRPADSGTRPYSWAHSSSSSRSGRVMSLAVRTQPHWSTCPVSWRRHSCSLHDAGGWQ